MPKGVRTSDVPVEPFARRFEELLEQGETAGEIARRMGFVHNGKADVTRLKRKLGLERWGRSQPATVNVRYETAVAFAEALHIDPIDCGI